MAILDCLVELQLEKGKAQSNCKFGYPQTIDAQRTLLTVATTAIAPIRSMLRVAGALASEGAKLIGAWKRHARSLRRN